MKFIYIWELYYKTTIPRVLFLLHFIEKAHASPQLYISKYNEHEIDLCKKAVIFCKSVLKAKEARFCYKNGL